MQNENGVLAVQEDFGNALVDKYAPVWDKKYRSKGEFIWVFQRRTLSSACQVATTLHDVNNPALTSPLVIDGACRATRKPG